MFRLAEWLAVVALGAPALAQFPIEWASYIESTGTSHPEGRSFSVASRPDGSVYVSVTISVGEAEPRFLFFTPTGQLAWVRNTAPEVNHYFRSVQVTSAGHGVFVGDRRYGPTFSCSVRCYSSTGALNWNVLLATNSAAPGPYPSTLDAAGNLNLACGANGAPSHSRVLRFGPGGNVLVDVALDFVPGEDESPRGVDLADNGDLLLCGSGTSLGFVARVDSAGQLLWSRSLPAPAGGSSLISGVRATRDGGLVTIERELDPLTGHGVRFRRFGGDGTPLASSRTDFGSGVLYQISDVERASDGGIWAVGYGANPARRAMVARFDPRTDEARSFVWNKKLPLDNIGPAVVPASLGQVWVLTSCRDSLPQAEDFGAALLVGPDFGGTPTIRQIVGSSTSGRWFYDATVTPQGRLIIAGKGRHPWYFDPLPWVCQVDIRAAPTGYCTAQTNPAGCTPQLSVMGFPLADATDGFTVRCGNAPPQRSGLFFYGTTGPASVPLGGGTLCVASPVQRGPVLGSGTSVDPCGGVLQLDWSAFTSGALGGTPLPGMNQAGSVVHVQGWIRDPSSPLGGLLSDALRYAVLP